MVEDLLTDEERQKIILQINPDIMISAQSKLGLEELKSLIYDKLAFIRVYLKEFGKKADMDIPLIIQSPVSIKTVCEKLHKEFLKKFRYARIWGSAKFPGQKFTTMDVPLRDKDVIEIRLR